MRKIISPHHSRSAGFTIVELAVIVPILVVAVTVLFQALFFMTRTSGIDRTKMAMTYDLQNSLGIIERDVLLTSSFLNTTDATVTDAYKPTSNYGQWSYQGDSLTSPNRVLILRNFSTTRNTLSINRQPSYLSEKGCDGSTIYTNQILEHNLIYFVKDGNLYRRHAVDTSKATCVTPHQQQSCPSLETLGQATRDESCKADDELLASDITAFSIQYFPYANSPTPIDVYSSTSDPSAVTTAASAEIRITMNRMSFGQNVTSNSSIRISKLNAQRNE